MTLMTPLLNPDMFEKIMDLSERNYSVKEWHRIHFEDIQLNSYDETALKLYPFYKRYLEQYANTGVALSVYTENNQCLAMFGVVPLHPGVAEAWLMPSKFISKHRFAFHRATKNFLIFMMAKWKLHRLQILVHSDNLVSKKWAEVLSFEQEGILKRYGVDKKNFFMYSRTYKNKR
tara:strand:+ start:3333 stop:3857 length:525 start_codon:yes stop_codon:yes gene_type:complete